MSTLNNCWLSLNMGYQIILLGQTIVEGKFIATLMTENEIVFKLKGDV